MKNYSIYMIVLLSALACKQTQKKEMVESENNDTKEEWVSLFDGKTFNGWHVYNDGKVTDPWVIEDGAMAFKGRQVDTIENNLVTDKEYTNFKLSVDWKISEAGNSGIMWGVVEDEKYEHPYDTGPEIQVLYNDKHPDR